MSELFQGILKYCYLRKYSFNDVKGFFSCSYTIAKNKYKHQIQISDINMETAM